MCQNDIKKRIDCIDAILERIKSMKAIMVDEVQVGMLLAFTDVPKLNAITAAIKTIAQKYIKWESITEILKAKWRGMTNEIKKSAKVGLESSMYCKTHVYLNC